MILKCQKKIQFLSHRTAEMRQTRKRKSRKQKAGKLVGLGGQGCVYAPPMRCSDMETPQGNFVSKLTTYAFAEVEKREFELLHTIDPEQQFTVYPLFGCHPAEPTEAELVENPLEKCTVHSLYPITDGRVLLFYPNGGQDLFEFQVAPNTSIAFFESLRNIIRGLSLLHHNNLVHMDIKPENIVTKWIPETHTFLTRIIDFGFSFRTTENPPDYAAFWKRNYAIWPYEIRFMNPAFNESMITPESVTEYMNTSIAYRNHMYPSALFDRYDADFYKYIWGKISKMSYRDRVDFLTKSTDVFSLGKALSFVYAKYTNHYCYGKKVRTTIDERYSIDIQMNDAIMLKEVSVPFYSSFIVYLLHPDPFTRPEIYEVDAMYTDFLKNFTQVRKKEKVQNQKKTRHASRK